MKKSQTFQFGPWTVTSTKGTILKSDDIERFVVVLFFAEFLDGQFGTMVDSQFGTLTGREVERTGGKEKKKGGGKR